MTICPICYAEYGPRKALYSGLCAGEFVRIFSDLAAGSTVMDTVMIDATHLKSAPDGGKPSKKGLFPATSGALQAD